MDTDQQQTDRQTKPITLPVARIRRVKLIYHNINSTSKQYVGNRIPCLKISEQTTSLDSEFQNVLAQTKNDDLNGLLE